jgi:hypothetical protein
MFDGLVKSRQKPIFVISVKTGIDWVCCSWIPACTVMTTFYEGVDA